MIPRDYLVTAALVVTMLAAAGSVITVGVCGAYHDDGIYVSTAKALAGGRGYRLIDLPGAPPQTKYPIVYPLALALLWRLWPAFPENLILLQGFSMVMAAVAAGAGYLYAVRVQQCDRLAAALALAICATSPIFVYFSTLALSELPFLAALVATLWLVARERERLTSRPAREWAVGAMIALPGLVRLVGAAVVLPLLWALWRRRGRLLWYAVGAGVPIATWFAWTWLAQNATTDVSRYYTDYGSWWSGYSRRFLRRLVASNALMTATATADWLPQIWRARGAAVLWPVVGIISWMVVARRARAALASSLFTYVAVVLVWPWPSARFIVPLWPLLLPIVCDAIRRKAGPVVVAIAAAFVIGANLMTLRHVAAANQATGYPSPPVPQPEVQWRSFERVFEWVRAHTSDHDTLTSGLDTMLFLYTGRPSIRSFATRPTALFYGDRAEAPIGSEADFLALLNQYTPRYVVQTPMPGFAEEAPFNGLLDRLRTRMPSCLPIVYRDDSDARFNVFAVDIRRCGAP